MERKEEERKVVDRGWSRGADREETRETQGRERGKETEGGGGSRN